MKVPERLKHLRTDRRGIPVPWINLWGNEDEARYQIRHDPFVRGPGLFLDDSREEVPDFTRQNMQRQRQSMMRGLCQVCARPVPWSRRFLVVSSLSVQEVDINTGKGRQPHVVVYEPWLDEFCAIFAMSKCPALIRRKDTDDLNLVPVVSKSQVQLVVSAGWVEGPLEQESKEVMPAMWVKALLKDVDIKVKERA